jgi:hypothetical protein
MNKQGNTTMTTATIDREITHIHYISPLFPVFLFNIPFVQFMMQNGIGLASFDFYFSFFTILLITLGLCYLSKFKLPYHLGKFYKATLTTVAIFIFIDFEFNFNYFMPNVAGLFSKIGPSYSIYIILLSFLVFFSLFIFLLYRLGNSFYRVGATLGGAILLFTIIFTNTTTTKPFDNSNSTNTAKDSKYYKSRVHFIVHNHMGLNGLPTEISEITTLKEQISDFYHKYNFTVYTNVLSNYPDSYSSLGNLVNFSKGDTHLFYYDKQSSPYTLNRNEYFKQYSSRGYNFNIYQFSDLNLCDSQKTNIKRCLTYSQEPVIALVKHGTYNNFTLIIDEYRKHLFLNTFLTNLYKTLFISNFKPNIATTNTNKLNIALPKFLGKIDKDVTASATGKIFFFNLRLPEGPYFYNEDCKLYKPTTEWQNLQNDAEFLSGVKRSSKVRENAYRIYAKQYRCLYNKLDELFTNWQDKKLLNDLLITIQGDGGSHIHTKDQTVQSDRDIYNTHFAYHKPGKTGRFINDLYNLNDIFSGVARNHSFGKVGDALVYTIPEQWNEQTFPPKEKYTRRSYVGAEPGMDNIPEAE